MNANEMTFGVEFEVCLPHAAMPAMTGGYHRGLQVPGLPEGWNSQSDCSIHPPVGYSAIEIVSPVLKGADGLKQIVAVCEWLNAKGAKVNQSTGFHVHVGYDRTNEVALKRLVATVANHEQAIYATTGSRYRETNGMCDSVLNSFDAKFTHKNGLPGSYRRYTLLNLANLVNGTKPTVEFRAFTGTTNATKAIGYVRLCVGFVERAIADTCPRCFGRKLPASVVDGVSSVRRMFKYLGWDKSECTFGRIEDAAVPTMKHTKKELLRLAAQYDARQEVHA